MNVLLLALLAAWLPAAHATSDPQWPTGFLTRYDFHLSGEALSSPSPHFSWEARFGGDLDLYAYTAGRLMLAADYEAILSDEVRLFEPIQNNYTVETAATYRTSLGELALVLHHVSRHLGDRAQVLPVDWNTIGVRFERRLAARGNQLLARVAVGRVFHFRYVDYSWMADGDASLDHPVRPNVALFARGTAHLVGVDPTLAARGTQYGGRIEAGVRLGGHRGSLELFAGYERRVDAEVLGRSPLEWALAGLRFVSR